MSAIARIDPDDPTSMVLPDEGDRVRLLDDAEGVVRSVCRARRGVVHHYLVLADDSLRTVFPSGIAGYPEGHTPMALRATPEDDGTEAEALAEVEVPRSPFAPPADADYSTAVEEGPLPQRDVGSTLDAPDAAQLIANRESIRAAYETQTPKEMA